MLAYFAPGVNVTGPARELPALARLLVAGPWQVCNATDPNGVRGALAWNGEGAMPDNLLTTGAWRTCGDGLRYRRPPVLPDQGALARANCPAGIDVLLASGVQLTIPLAAAAPRKFSLGNPGLGAPSTDFGIVADRVFQRLVALPAGKTLSILDPDVLAAITQAIMAAYRVTPELVDDLDWLSSQDVDPILCAIMGSDPKASAPVPSTSPSPAVASETSR